MAATPAKRDVDYVFYELTRSICPECRQVIDAHIILRDNKVYMRKRCREHGRQYVRRQWRGCNVPRRLTRQPGVPPPTRMQRRRDDHVPAVSQQFDTWGAVMHGSQAIHTCGHLHVDE